MALFRPDAPVSPAYNRAVPFATPGLVEIVREFLAVDRAVVRVLSRYRNGELRFEEVQELVADHEDSALFRLKERCHTLFRAGSGHPHVARHREVLFDLAVGSLFHETMKFRENFYQREVYGPRVRALRNEAGEEAASLFSEFEKIQGAVSDRLEEGLLETEALLARTGEQLRVLLIEHGDDGPAARFLIESRDLVDEVFEEGLDALLAHTYGSTADGYSLAGRSYLESGYYKDADRVLSQAAERGGDPGELEPAIAYARGMDAYLRGDYRESIRQLDAWCEGSREPETRLLALVQTAFSKIDDLAQGEDREETLSASSALLERVSRLRGAGNAVASA